MPAIMSVGVGALHAVSDVSANAVRRGHDEGSPRSVWRTEVHV